MKFGIVLGMNVEKILLRHVEGLGVFEMHCFKGTYDIPVVEAWLGEHELCWLFKLAIVYKLLNITPADYVWLDWYQSHNMEGLAAQVLVQKHV